MTFSLNQGELVMLSRITQAQSSNIHLLPHTVYLTPVPWFSVVAPFDSLSQPHQVTASHSSPGDNHQSTGGRSERKPDGAKMTEWNSFSYICSRALHSFLSFTHCCAPSIVIPLLPKATFIQSIQPNLGLPHIRPPLNSAINTLPANTVLVHSFNMPRPSLYSLIRSTC